MLQITLKKLRESAGLSQAALGNKIGVRQSTIGMWESGKNKPEFANLEKLAKVFNVSVSYLLESSDNDTRSGVLIPVLGNVAAGIPIEAIQDILGYEEIDKDMARTGEFFGLRIQGQSMEPRMCDGDIVVVRKQDDVNSGETAVVLVNGDSATVKKIKKRLDGITLIPTNPVYDPIFYSNAEILSLPVRIIGKVVELRAKY